MIADKDKNYLQYLKQKHSRLVTPVEVIQSVLKKVTPEPVKFERLIKGEDNEVYSVRAESGQGFILRIAHNENNFERERAAIDIARQSSVAVPEVLLVEERELNGERLAFCLENRIPGTPLSDLHDMSLKEKMSFAAKAGSILEKFHTLKSTGLDVRNEFNYWTPEDVVRSALTKPEKFSSAAQRAGMSKTEIAGAFEIMEKGVGQLAGQELSFLHGDFGPKHLLIDRGDVSGVVDFGDARSGLPIEDIARWDFYFDREYPVEWVLAGYSNKAMLGKNLEQQIRFFSLHQGLKVLEYFVSEKNTAGFDFAVMKMRRDLDYFKNL